MNTDDMYTVWDYENAKQPLCYCKDSKTANFVSEVLESRIDNFVVDSGKKPVSKDFSTYAEGLDELKLEEANRKATK